ncbi:hypothetical protein ACW9HJ_19105 [Nocardia gipuzkoensis]
MGEELHGRAEITPEMHVPGTTVLRTSVLATWADTVSGLLASLVMGPRVPVTLELDVGLYRPAPGTGEVRAGSSLGLRYLLGARVGPVVAQARLHEGLGRVELRDSGNDNRLTTLATARTFGG